MDNPAKPRVAMALVHFPVRDRLGGERASSVTPLNVHDLARAAATYGVSPFYVVTPLISQQALVKRILRHWLEGYGGEQNPSRRRSLGDVSLVSSVNEAMDDLLRLEGAYPYLVGTGAGKREGLTGYDELADTISSSTRPWLLLFGTGWGLIPELLDQCDAFLSPIEGRGEFNHLSVRSAASIILDRLFGK